MYLRNFIIKRPERGVPESRNGILNSWRDFCNFLDFIKHAEDGRNSLRIIGYDRCRTGVLCEAHWRFRTVISQFYADDRVIESFHVRDNILMCP
jgi:hypothetical protein